MDIAFAFDESYAGHAQVAIESILDCHAHRDDLTFWLLTTPAVAAARATSLRHQACGRARIEFLSTDDTFRALPVSQIERCAYISAGMYLRLFLPGLLPPTVERLLYLDCDVLVSGDLGPLWETPFGTAAVAAVRDGYTRALAYEGGIPGAGPQLDGNEPYFNSGVLLMNLPVWRRLDVTGRCLEYLSEYADRLRFPDQDALNLVCYGRWLRLDASWNDTVKWRLEPETHARQRGQVRIHHFLGPAKPWQRDFPYTGYRERYRELAVQAGRWPVNHRCPQWNAAPFPTPLNA
jgi:lipopolysaccharide biosynthesis glycosyltransferase